ncbi:MAG: hypothetical protein ABJA78_02930 [Ferruginibacter sp.]
MKNISKYIDLRKSSSLGLILGLIATIAQIISLSTPYVLGVSIASFIVLCFSLFLHFKTKHLPHIPQAIQGIEVRRVLSPAEFDELDNIYHHCFGSSSVPTEILKNWWLSYPQGLVIILKDGNVIGGSSIWPMDDKTFEKMKCGYIKEKEIAACQIDPKSLDKWYISEIALIKGERNLFNLITLINGIVNQLTDEITSDYPAYILALGYSNEGISLMKRFGFIKEVHESKTADKLPLYMLAINSISDLSNLKIKLNALYNSKKESDAN